MLNLIGLGACTQGKMDPATSIMTIESYRNYGYIDCYDILLTENEVQRPHFEQRGMLWHWGVAVCRPGASVGLSFT
jgi:hypothetical protein